MINDRHAHEEPLPALPVNEHQDYNRDTRQCENRRRIAQRPPADSPSFARLAQLEPFSAKYSQPERGTRDEKKYHCAQGKQLADED